ncbi:MAG TPA: hypothetical protein VLJ42_12380 [Solirubrobacteraceae bacterium]|nr:hypothetical protein [Solirubrobacteraceae bacterium]
MAESLFLFTQLEFPWALGPADGRYLLRAEAGAQPEHVVVLGTLSAARASTTRRRLGTRRLGPEVDAEPAPAAVGTTRATIVDAVPLSTERQAQTWLSELDPERQATNAVAVLNRVLFAQRIASADPYVHELSAAQALVIRAGWGEGYQVADGHWLHARELPLPEPRSRKRVAALRPQERLAELVSARGQTLICEELTLRARLDLDQGRFALAALELERAYAAALPELAAQQRPDLAARLSELEQLRAGVQEQARAALPGDHERPSRELVQQALERLEAALRARTATGF